MFHDVVREERYDLWVGDEAWELDYYLHENPGEKRAHYAWLTDFVGWLPMEDGGSTRRSSRPTTTPRWSSTSPPPRGARPGAVRRQPRGHRARPARAELPLIRDWTESHFDFAGYVSGFDPEA